MTNKNDSISSNISSLGFKPPKGTNFIDDVVGLATRFAPKAPIPLGGKSVLKSIGGTVLNKAVLPIMGLGGLGDIGAGLKKYTNTVSDYDKLRGPNRSPTVHEAAGKTLSGWGNNKSVPWMLRQGAKLGAHAANLGEWGEKQIALTTEYPKNEIKKTYDKVMGKPPVSAIKTMTSYDPDYDIKQAAKMTSPSDYNKIIPKSNAADLKKDLYTSTTIPKVTSFSSYLKQPISK